MCSILANELTFVKRVDITLVAADPIEGATAAVTRAGTVVGDEVPATPADQTMKLPHSIIAATLGSVLAATLASMFVVSCTSDGADDGVGVPGVADTTTTPPPPPSTTPTTLPPATTAVPTTTTTTAAPTTTTTPPTTIPPSTTPPTAPPGPFYRAGDEGPEIAILQLKLQTVGFLDPGYTDGVFDSATNSAVLEFQGQYGLIVDGIVGPETEAALTAAALSVNPEPG